MCPSDDGMVEMGKAPFGSVLEDIETEGRLDEGIAEGNDPHGMAPKGKAPGVMTPGGTARDAMALAVIE